MADIRKQLKWSKLKVGAVITLALFILLVTVFFAGNIEDLFVRKVELKANFRDVKGLRKGAPVWIFGTEVGSVKEIDLNLVYGTVVGMRINKSALEYINKDSKASILTMGLLGDKFVEISAGSPQAGPIHPGEMIQGTAEIELKDVIETGAATIETMTSFIKKLESLVTKIEEGQGTVAKFLNDPSVYNSLNKTAQALSSVAEEIHTSQGTLKMLIDNPSLYQKTLEAASNLEETTRMIKESSGTLKRLVEDPSIYNKTLEAASHIEAFSTKLEEFTTKLNESQGSLKKFIEDPVLYENVNKSAIQLSSVLERIDKGEGLAAAFLKNKELVTDLDETIVQIRKTAQEFEALVKDIKANPKRYLKFSVF